MLISTSMRLDQLSDSMACYEYLISKVSAVMMLVTRDDFCHGKQVIELAAKCR